MEFGCRGFLHEFAGKKLIAYGTGHAGKLIIPFLARLPQVNLIGVTNSRMQNGCSGAYLDTGLPTRSLREWVQLSPDAVIIITAFRGYDEIYTVCQEVGFQKVLFPSLDLIEASMQAMEEQAEFRMLADLEALCLANEIRDTHMKSFSPFKGCHKGQSVAVIGSGPTLNYYSQMDDVVHIGTNASFLRDNLKLDYYFMLHYVPAWCEKLKEYGFTKFFGINRNGNSHDKVPEYILEENGARSFFFSPLLEKIHTNIEYYPLMGYLSVIFPALQFALYTRPEKIYLVGCDCSDKGHFDGTSQRDQISNNQVPIWIKGYEKFREFANRHYPDTEIISVNPVQLKGLFSDLYTLEFLTIYPNP